MRINRAVFVMVAALSAAACGGTNHPNTLIAREVPAVVYFENASSEQAAVYAVSGGESRRIGTVFAGRLEKLRVPASMVARGSVRLNDVPLDAGDGAAVRDVKALELRDAKDAEVLLFDLA